MCLLRIEVLTAFETIICSRSEATADNELMDTARELAKRIAANPPQQLRIVKRLLRQSPNLDLAQMLEMSAVYQSVCHQTSDHAEAISALLEKRAGNFTGQ